jgi:hypothetical protein
VLESSAFLSSKAHLDSGKQIKNPDLGGLHLWRTTPHRAKENKEFRALALGQQLQNIVGYIHLEE